MKEMGMFGVTLRQGHMDQCEARAKRMERAA
jgi:hypothetical protein